MKETLFEMLLNLFETTLLRIKEASELHSGQNSLPEQKKKQQHDVVTGSRLPPVVEAPGVRDGRCWKNRWNR